MKYLRKYENFKFDQIGFINAISDDRDVSVKYIMNHRTET